MELGYKQQEDQVHQAMYKKMLAIMLRNSKQNNNF